MSHTYKPVIVVAGYNRDVPLKRILKSLSGAYYPDGDISLVISLDKSDNPRVSQVARDFFWQHGQKVIIEHESNLGLRSHILKCGDLTEKYGSIILLEDDLYVSPFFYQYAQKALSFYGSEARVAGVSLYSQRYNETAFMRFTPLKDENDVYFMQIPSSWGQAWTKEQWKGFRDWYDLNHTKKITDQDTIPPNVVLWPETSWKKYYFKYVIEQDKYFIYPYRALSTNFADVGTHHMDNRTCLQEPLEILNLEYKFPQFGKSKIIYDSHCELHADCLKGLCPELADHDFEVDLYGTKRLEKIQKPFILTSKKSSDPVKSFGRGLKPHEMNIIHAHDGSTFHLVSTANSVAEPFKMIDSTRNSYYYDIPEFLLLKAKDNLRAEDQVSADAKILSGYHEYNALKNKFSFKFFKLFFDLEGRLQSLFSSKKV